uniref:Uncharacterized protein n=1 Tax=Steinernema glaseri TaxID=37863 RepID=A0A1I8AWH8_9BILA
MTRLVTRSASLLQSDLLGSFKKIKSGSTIIHHLCQSSYELRSASLAIVLVEGEAKSSCECDEEAPFREKIRPPCGFEPAMRRLRSRSATTSTVKRSSIGMSS